MLKSVYVFIVFSICILLVGCGDSSDYGADFKQQKENVSKTNACENPLIPYCDEEITEFKNTVENSLTNSASIEQGNSFPSCGSANDNQILVVQCYNGSAVRYGCMASIRKWTLLDSKDCSENIVDSDSVIQTDAKDDSVNDSIILYNVDFEKNVLLDSRDSQTYKITVIGNQIWMAQDLNYKIYRSECNTIYEENEDCVRNGRTYTWAAAVGKTESECGMGEKCLFEKKGICPAGWHLPSKEEWEVLITAVGDTSIAGKMLKSRDGWSRNGGGLDAFGFRALPNRDLYGDGGRGVDFWSSTPSPYYGLQVYAVSLSNNYDGMLLPYLSSKDETLSIRCLMDKSASEIDIPVSNTQIISSSSEMISSSSVERAVPCKTATWDICVYGTLTDSRDGQVYKTRKIGSQTWMAENLDYKIDYIGLYNLCYDNKCYESKHLSPSGQSTRLYSWDAAKVACPEGWHLPNKVEFETLLTTIGGGSMSLMSQYGLTVALVGYRSEERYLGNGSEAGFWSSTIQRDDFAYCLFFYAGESKLSVRDIDYLYSIRCLQD